MRAVRLTAVRVRRFDGIGSGRSSGTYFGSPLRLPGGGRLPRLHRLLLSTPTSIYFVTFGFGFSIMENLWQLVFMDVRLVLMLAIPLLTMRPAGRGAPPRHHRARCSRIPLRDGVVVAAKLGACLLVDRHAARLHARLSVLRVERAGVPRWNR